MKFRNNNTKSMFSVQKISFDFISGPNKYFAEIEYKDISRNKCELILLNITTNEELRLKINEAYRDVEYKIRNLRFRIRSAGNVETARRNKYQKNWLKRISHVENKLRRLNQNKNYDFQD